jgi:hypothetical protein
MATFGDDVQSAARYRVLERFPLRSGMIRSCSPQMMRSAGGFHPTGQPRRTVIVFNETGERLGWDLSDKVIQFFKCQGIKGFGS